jgi:hypothetical protein
MLKVKLLGQCQIPLNDGLVRMRSRPAQTLEDMRVFRWWA